MMINGGFQGNTKMYLIRYADVVLLAAESAMMLNNRTKQRTILI
jgi:hypothetical protein